MPANADRQIIFRRQKTEERLGPVWVCLVPVSSDFQAHGAALDATHEIIWDDLVTYADGKKPRAGDWVEWDGFTSREAELHKPARYASPFPLAMALVRERE